MIIPCKVLTIETKLRSDIDRSIEIQRLELREAGTGMENVATRFSCVHGLGGHTLVQDLNCGEHVSSMSFII